MLKPLKQTPKKSTNIIIASADSTDTESITATWTLAELPSPQHRAGLAGLVMMLGYTKRHKLPDGALLEIATLDEARLEVRLNLDGLKALMDQTYDADREEIEVPRPWMKKQKDGSKAEVPPKRRQLKTVTDKKGITKDVEVCVYDTVVPRGGPLAEWSPPDDGGRWVKLWRDWLWATLRAIPKQRTPYIQRAGAGVAVEADDAETDEDAKDILVAWHCLTADGPVKLASTYYLGAMDVNAENVSFQDRGRFLFLLHFWPFAIHLFIPQHLNAKGDREFDGFVTCIPDVARLKDFVDRHVRALRGRNHEAAGFRPKQAIIDLAEAAALEAEQWLADAIAEDVQQADARATAGFQIIHAAKEGNSVRIRSNRMVTPTREMTDRSRVVNRCWSHLAKHQVLVNVLAERPWWHGFDRICANYSKNLTIKDSGFCHDASLLFNHFNQEDHHMPDSASETPKVPRSLEPLILHIVTSWIAGRLDSKYKLSWNAVKDTPRKSEYDEKRAKLASEAFLAARSRPGREFSRWFTSTLCSVSQRLSEAEFVSLAQALEERPDHVRSLTLLALSARG